MTINKNRKIKIKKPNETDNAENQVVEPKTLDSSLEMNIEIFKEIFKDDDTVVFRHFSHPNDNRLKCCIIFIECMVKTEVVNDNIIRPIVQCNNTDKMQDIINELKENVIITSNIEKTADINDLIKALIMGDTLLFVEDASEGLAICTKGWQSRAITEPEAEKTVSGAKEGFIEAITINLTLLRRKIDSPKLKFKYSTIGEKTKTKICVSYIEGVANDKILEELYKRLSEIKIDGVLGAAYIEESIKDAPLSIFKTVGYTEKPDVAAAKLLEGRIAVFIDGSPTVLTLPFLFLEYFQSNADYYDSFYFASVNRIIRYIGVFIAISLAPTYLALVAFHQEMIPINLLFSISSSRQGVPFPTLVEILLLLFSFELLREASVKMPSVIGQSLSILGALVLGQAAVQAKFFSAPIVIIVALSAITGLLLPKMKVVVIIFRLLMLALASLFGFYGCIVFWMVAIFYLCQLRSFGVPYVLNLSLTDYKELKDTAIRVPWWMMKNRPKFIAAQNRIRQRTDEIRNKTSHS